MKVLSLELVCSITGFEEAVRRDGGWEHRAKAAAAAPNSQCAWSEQKHQGDNKDPRANRGAAIRSLGSSFSLQRLFQSGISSIAD